MRKILLALLIGYLPLCLKAQHTGIRDSLFQLLPTTKADTNRAIIYYRLARYYESNNQDSANYFLQQCWQLSGQLQFTKGKYLFYERSAVVAFNTGNYAKAMEASNNGLVLARALKDSSFVIVMLNNIAITYGYLEKYHEQLSYTLQVKKAIEGTNDSSKMSGLYHNLANCYNNLAQYRKAADCALQAIYLFEQLKLRNDFINRTYATLGQNYEQLHLTDSALLAYEKAVSTSIQANDKYAEVTIYMYINHLYTQLKKFPAMLPIAQKSVTVAAELQSRPLMAISLYNLAAAQFYNGDQSGAKKNVEAAISIARADSLKDELQNSYGLLSYIAAKEGDFAASVTAKSISDSIRDAALNEKIIRSTTEMEKKYESEKKDTQLKLQQDAIQRKNTFNYLLIASALGILLISFLSYRNYRHKQQLQLQRIQELETEKTLTATEAVLKGEEQERTRLAKDLHDGLGGMLSGIKYSFNSMKGNLIMTPENLQAFERSIDMLDSSIAEMRRVAHNMMPAALVKFGLDAALKDFCNDINYAGALAVSYQSIGIEQLSVDQTTAITIYRIVQELINNIIKHAGATHAVVQLTQSNQQITITVEDDGKGFDVNLLQCSKGIGWSNIQNRIAFLKGTVDIKSYNNKGTSVLIELNLAS